MPNQLSIFDQYGNISNDIDPNEVAKLPEADKSVLADTLHHCREAEKGEARVVELRLKVRSLMERHDAALEADNAANPAMTHMEALQASIAATNKYVAKPKPRKFNAETRAVLDQVSFELAKTRDDFQHAINSQRGLDQSKAKSIINWIACQQPVTFASIHKEMVDRSNAERLARVERGEHPDPVVVEPIRLSPIDVDYAARGKVKKQPAYLGSRKAF